MIFIENHCPMMYMISLSCVAFRVSKVLPTTFWDLGYYMSIISGYRTSVGPRYSMLSQLWI